MKLYTLLALATAAPVFAQNPLAAPATGTVNTNNYPTIGQVVRFDPALEQLIPKDAKIEVVATGFEWSEGAVWNKLDGSVLFSDIPRNCVMRWKEKIGTTLFLEPAGYTGTADYGKEPGSNGLAFDSEGRLISCEHGYRRISMLTKDGGKRTLADNYQGKRLNSPNDLAIKSNGDIYFTDPPYGLPNRYEDPRRELDFCGVYRYSKADGSVTLLSKEMTRPNGIAFSPDEKTLYVAQSDPKAAIWKSFPVKEDGTIGDGKLFFDATSMVGKMKGLPDGLKVDKHGNLWATGPGGVHIFSPEGKPLGRIDTGEATANCAWGGVDGSVLYLTADMYIARIKTSTTGNGF
jgi:gluconolactonase